MTVFSSTPCQAFIPIVLKLGQKLRPVFSVLFFLGLTNAAWASPVNPFPGDTTITAAICANETYPFNGQLLNTPGIYTATYLASDGSDSIVTLMLQVRPLSESNTNAAICQGEVFEFNGSPYTQSGVYTAVLSGHNGCDSIARLKLTVYPTIVTKLSAGICEGTGYVFQGEILETAGVYSAVLSSIHGCDSIVQLSLAVVPFFEIPVAASICNGETYSFGGNDLDQAGVYVNTLTAIGGCDSIVTLTLSILPVPTTVLKVGICEGSSYLYEGDLFNTSGVYVYNFTAANGCDSIVMLDLSVVPFFDVTAEATICNGETYPFGTEELTTPGVYSHLFTAIGGCDSTVVLTLNVLPTKSASVQASICDGETFEYHGTSLSDPGLYQFVLTAANGCDSTVQLTLNVLPVPNTVIEASICEGDSYDLNGETYSTQGVFEQTFTSFNGCDSIVSLVLTLLPHAFSQVNATVCNGETYDFFGEILELTGTYTHILPAYNGCDSTVTLKLNVLPVLQSEQNESICAGTSYEFDGSLLTDAGTYTAVFAGTNDCDSTVTLHLSILPTQSSNLEASICAGSVYAFNGDDLTDAGTYTAVLTGANGCDSTVTLVLTVLPTQTTQISATICAGESYPYFGTSLSAAGVYAFVFPAENGCDSTVMIDLTVLPVAQTSVTASICAGASYDFNGEILTQSGNYDQVYNAFNGCDSIVTLHLTVLPLPSASLTVTLCSGSSYDFDGQTLSTSGTYTSVGTGANGCDSTTTLQLTFVMEFVTNLEASVCAGEVYAFNGQNLSVAGVYNDTLSAVGGCDSLVSLTLTILPLSESVSDVAICANEFYEFNGEVLASSGTYTDTLSSVNGCDSIAVLHLTVLPVQSTTLDISTCSNEPYIFNGLSLGQSGNYTAVLSGVNGCDSTVMLHLTVLPIASNAISATICANETYLFDGIALNQTGTYSATYDAANGCDSLVTLQLTVLPRAQSGTAAVVCEGQPFEYNGEVFTQSGTYTFNFPGAAANGCDSVETLFLTIFPLIPETHVSVTLCGGETYPFDGQILTTSGTYTAELASATGCDSVVVLDLTIFPISGLNINATICNGESFEFQGQLVTQPGTYTATFADVNGCDSIVLLTLTVNQVNTNVTLQGGTLSAQAQNAQYQWINCANNQPVPGATGSSFTPSVTGQYAVQIIDQNGCSAESDCQLVQVVATLEPWSQSDWSLQPNPASQSTVLVLNEAVKGALKLEVYDPAGRLLRQLEVAAGTQQLVLELTDLSEGMLLVRLVNERGVSSKMLMKAGK